MALVEMEREWMDDWVARWLVGAGGDGGAGSAMVEVLVARWGAVVLVMDGAVPRRPGRGGGRRWRRKGSGERDEMPGPGGDRRRWLGI